MNNCCRLSNVAKDYLTAFRQILNTMMQGMTTVPLTNSISYNFMVQMIPHHQGAIEMSENLLRFTTFLPLQDMAEQIITEQTQSIADMKKILCSCELHSNSGTELQRYQQHMDQIMETMFSAMKSAPDTNQLNVNFIREMLPHHQGAVEMSRLTLQYDICPGLRPILEAIITSQQQEILEMKKLLRRLGCR